MAEYARVKKYSWLLLFVGAQAMAQEHHHEQSSSATPAVRFLQNQSSGTATNPTALPVEMWSGDLKGWTLMGHALAFLTSTQQTGPRGLDDVYSTNWIMGSAIRPLGSGALQLRSMISLEPATIDDRRYPLLFQTGETAYGEPIVDGQHPHDFIMELAVEYAHPTPHGIAYIYLAPVGDPAIGPVAFPHRASAIEIPQAVLGHHYQDSTHIANNVATVGLDTGTWRVEASSFHGAEPDEHRWDIDGGDLDSWAARVTWTPMPNLVMQASHAFLKKPEELEPGDADRTTASASYGRTFNALTVAATLVWGEVIKKESDTTLHSWLAESMFQFRDRHYLSVRAESNDKDELFAHSDHPESFRVDSLTLGYTYDVLKNRFVRVGVGGNMTGYRIPSELEESYGEDPFSTAVFLRLKSAGAKHAH